jgi:hypothetical protein
VEGAERDSTQDWLLPESKAPPRLAELALRVDEALAIARASERAVNVVGDAALEAAKQARRAAELAESASAVALDASRAVQSRKSALAMKAGVAAEAEPDAEAVVPDRVEPAIAAVPSRASEDDLLQRFNERADRVMTRLRALERVF